MSRRKISASPPPTSLAFLWRAAWPTARLSLIGLRAVGGKMTTTSSCSTCRMTAQRLAAPRILVFVANMAQRSWGHRALQASQVLQGRGATMGLQHNRAHRAHLRTDHANESSDPESVALVKAHQQF
mmetsp:Transcript_20400/g.39853  ORF Transcript_20400/g.39853 Transcript_20400/m.39853 type:complete len:127 (+) Transcript_20400:1370-1750(+)